MGNILTAKQSKKVTKNGLKTEEKVITTMIQTSVGDRKMSTIAMKNSRTKLIT